MFGQPAPQPSPEVEMPIPAGADSISSLDWNPAGNMIAAGSWENKIRIWEVQRNPAGGAPTGGSGKAEKDTGSPVLDVEWKDDGAAIFSGGCGKTIKMWNLQADQVVDIGSHDAPVKGVHWVKEKQYLVSGGWDKNIKYWDARTPTAQVGGDGGSFCSAVWACLGVLLKTGFPLWMRTREETPRYTQ